MVANVVRPLVVVATMLAASVASAQGVELFNVAGSNPGSANVDYRGEVAVAKSGGTWQIEWRVGGAPIRGTGIIMDGNYLAAAGMLEGRPFVFIMRKDGSRFVGEWTVQGQSQVGKEVWTPK